MTKIATRLLLIDHHLSFRNGVGVAVSVFETRGFRAGKAA